VAAVALFVVGLGALAVGVLLFLDFGRGGQLRSTATVLIAVANLASALLRTAAVLFARGGAGSSPHP